MRNFFVCSALGMALLSCSFFTVASAEENLSAPQSSPQASPQSTPQAGAKKFPRKLEQKAAKIEDDGSEATEDFSPRPYGNEKSTFTVARASRLQLGLELLGSALIYSFQGSVLLTDHIAINGGLAYFGVSSGSGSNKSSANLFLIPFSASYLMGGPDSHFEFLAGAMALYASSEVKGDGIADRASGSTFIPEVGLGYRYWPAAGGFHFRATLYGVFIPDGFGVWPGLSFGYAF